MTERYYYADSHLKRFTARVISCAPAEGGWEVILDGTAFFPEGGGQNWDTGTLGGVRVTAVTERDGDVVHRTDGPLAAGAAVEGVIDWDRRFRSMQDHTAEHIVSGIVHRLYGYENVGFHLGADGAIVDFSGYLTPEQLAEVERLANEAVWADAPVRAWFPTKEELKSIPYRSKLDLKENVRLVEIEGWDVCACCATHVARTGEIGVIRILDSIRRHESGVRIRMTGGREAYRECREKADAVGRISALLSAPPEKTPEAVERLLEEKAAAASRVRTLTDRLAERIAEGAAATEGDLLFFEDALDAEGMRTLVNAARRKCGGIAACFAREGDGYRYVMGSEREDTRTAAKDVNAALGGRGGGRPEMVQGSLAAAREAIEDYFRNR